MLEVFETDLLELERQGRLRALRGRAGADFTSNDYLGMAESEELKLRGRGGHRARRAGRIGRIAPVARQSPRA